MELKKDIFVGFGCVLEKWVG